MAAAKKAAKKTATPVVEDEDQVAEDASPEETVEDAAPTSGKGVAVVSWPGGVREYSKEVHGADFKKLAAEFAEKKGGRVA